MKTATSTLEMSREDWLKARKQGIGSSDVGAILGLNKYKTPLEVYEEKISPEIVEIPMTPALEFGIKLESVVADTYAERTGRQVVRDNKIRIHPEHPFLIANLDRIIRPSNGEGRGILEVKTASSMAVKQWGTEIPLSYFAQVEHQLNVTGMEWGVLALLVDGREFQTFDVKRDDAFIAMMQSVLIDFWENHVLTHTPPDPTVSDLEIQTVPPDSVIEADDSILADVAHLPIARRELKTMEARVEEMEDRVKLYIGTHEMLTHGGKVLATWKKSKDSLSLDTKRLMAEMPTIASKFQVTKPGSRRFLLKEVQ